MNECAAQKKETATPPGGLLPVIVILRMDQQSAEWEAAALAHAMAME
jgi:hypothetical protein